MSPASDVPDLADPFYADVARVFGAEALAGAGYVPDAPRAELGAPSLWPLCTPTHKLVSPSNKQIPLVLLCTGCYSPPHVGHLAMMARARTAARAQGLEVAGAYLSPSHDDYVGIKNGGVGALSAAHRLRLCQAAVAGSDFLMVCPWEARWVGGAVNFTDVILRLQEYLRAHWRERTEVIYVCGADNAGFARAFVERGRCVIVPRAGYEEQAARVLADPKMAAACSSGRVLLADSKRRGTESSSSARSTGAGVPPAVAAELSSWELDWSQVASQPPLTRESSTSLIYVLRDDLEWASSRWRSLTSESELEHALACFRSGVVGALKDAFSGVSWPDRPHSLNLRVLDVAAQAQAAAELMRSERVLSLDLCVPAHQHLHVCREFGLADGQVYSQRLRSRPGYPSLMTQLQGIAREPAVTLVDDDTSTGFTFASVQLLLESRGIAVRRTFSLLDDEQPRPHDVCDLRDFLLGARDAGLVVRLPNGELTRAPYLPPWVTLSARAKTPLSSEWALGRQLWQLNQEFFAGLGLLVADAHASTRALLHAAGAQPGELLTDFCAREGARMQQLPFRLSEHQDKSAPSLASGA